MKKFFKISIIIFLVFFVIGLISLIVILSKISSTVSLNDLDKSKLVSSYYDVPIYDCSDNLINPCSNFISIEELSDYTKNAFISIEDKDFYTHNGLNYKRILMALINNIKSGSFKEGASTISQQLVKNTQLNNNKTISRKIKEIYITQELEKEYSKDQILEMYLNNIYYGASSYGIQSASKNYFSKDAKDLSLSESAILAGLIKSPATYSPIYNLDNCIKRRNLVLKEMLKDNYITEDEYNQAINDDVALSHNYTEDSLINETYDYMSLVLKEASSILGISEEEIKLGGYNIYTYLDIDKQYQVFDIINSENYIIKNKNNIPCQGIVNIVDNKNNALVAFASNTNFDVTNLDRQPGSAIKPFVVYAPGFEKGLISPMSKILDEAIDIDGYKPQNVGNCFNGYISVRDAVAYSLNIPAIKILQEVGIDNAKSFASNCGISFDDNDNGLAIALGGFTKGITLPELTNSYTVFANNGYYRPFTTIRKITNKYNVSIYTDNRQSNKVMGDDTAYLVTSVLQDGVKYGTSKRLNNLKCDIAGKTGTVAVPNTNNNTDAISVAYTTDYSVGCWLGNYTLEKEGNLDGSNNGGNYATSVIKDVFDYLNDQHQPNKFVIPNSIQKCKINKVLYDRDNKISLATNDCSDRYIVEDYFSKRFLPNILIQPVEKIEPLIKLSDNNNLVTIKFQAIPMYQYEIVKIENNKEKVLKIVNDSELIEYVDTDILPGKEYTYYVKYKSKEKSIYNISQKYTIKIPDNKYLEDTSYYNWLFS